jgi:hypothetical protein
MKEIALHIIDIVQNSITAGASLGEVSLLASRKDDRLTIEIRDDGSGMDADMLKGVTSPFVTTRTTRRVGLGLSLFQAGAEATGGGLRIDSAPGKGTDVRVEYVLEHVDRPPIGDFAGTMHTLIICNPDIDVVTEFDLDGSGGRLDTREVRQVVGEVPLDTPEVSNWLRENLDEIFKPEFAEI